MLSTQRIVNLLICLLVFSSGRLPEGGRSYFNEPFRLSSVDSVAKFFVSFNDTIPNDTLYFCFSNGNPAAIFRDIISGVCLDGECRPLRIKVYWTISGRYLGYQLNPTQELTKKEHTPFNEVEYRLLHNLLSDSLSLLVNYTLEEITPKKQTNIKTDGISGATPPNISSYIVPEAAYTTHTLWHLVYSETRDSINLKIKSFLTFSVLDSLLASSNDYDRLWALNHLPSDANHYLPRLMNVLEGDNIKVIEKALSYLAVYSDSIYQQSLFGLSQKHDYFIRQYAMELIRDLDNLQPGIARKIIDCMINADPASAGAYLSAIEKFNSAEDDLRKISILLDNSNDQVALNAYLYLMRVTVKGKWLAQKLKKFEKQKLKI